MNSKLLEELRDPRVIAALTLGTGRAALEPPASLAKEDASEEAERWPLVAAAVLGQERSFRRQSAPKLQGGARLPASEGPWLTESERTALRRLVAVERDHICLFAALWASVAASPRKLHPFDLPALRSFLTDSAATLGPVESAWLALTSTARRSDAADSDAPADGSWTDESWMEATPAAQGDYAAARRRENPAEGRALIQKGVEGQPAATRCRLVEALAWGLSDSDRELLESLLEDRAKTVKEASARLLSRLPGTPQYAERIEDAVARLDVGKKGMTGRKKTLKLRRKGTGRVNVIHHAQSTFQYLRSEDLASALGMSLEDMFRAAAKDARLQSVFLVRAMVEGVEATARAAPLLPDGDGWAAVSDWVNEGDSTQLSETLPLVLRPHQWDHWPSVHELNRLQEIIGGPLPVELARSILDGDLLKTTLKEVAESPSPDGTPFLPLVGLMPPSLHPSLKERLAALPFHCTSVLLELIQLTAALLDPNPTDD